MNQVLKVPSAPFVSIITPIFNRCYMLRNCIESVISQGILDFELILVDDASTEDTRSIMERYEKKYPEQIRCHFCTVNQGPSVARNIGLDMAKGKYITFLDSDDRFAPNFLAKSKFLAAQNNSDMIVFSFDILNTKGQLVQHGKSVMLDGKPDLVGLYTNPNIARLYRRAIIERYHFRYPEKKLCEDALWALMTNAVCASVTAVEDVGYLNTDHGGSLSRDRDRYAKLSAAGLPLKAYDHMQGMLSQETADAGMFDYFCATFAMLACFLWSSRGSFSGLKKVVRSLYPSQKRIIGQKNPYLKYSAYKLRSFRKHVRLAQHFAVVSCIWLFRLRIALPTAAVHNFFARFWRGELFRKQEES